MNMWIGLEKEGKHKGKRTLFIGSNKITIKDIDEAAKYQAFVQIYFGAGVCTKINYDIVKEALKLYPNHIITLEVDYKVLKKVPLYIINSYAEIIITITDNSFNKLINRMKESVQIKIQSLSEKNKFIALCLLKDFKNVDTSELRIKTYKGDKVLK